MSPVSLYKMSFGWSEIYLQSKLSSFQLPGSFTARWLSISIISQRLLNCDMRSCKGFLKNMFCNLRGSFHDELTWTHFASSSTLCVRFLLYFFGKNQLSSESFSVSELWKMCSSFASSKKKSPFFTVLTPVGRSFSFSIYERIYFCAGQSVALLCENIFDLSSKCDEGNLHQPG